MSKYVKIFPKFQLKCFSRNYFGEQNYGLYLCLSISNNSKGPGGGIGRRAGLKIQ
jgi:hypothetical protein